MKNRKPKYTICYNQPSPQNLIVYYVTKVLGLPIWADTDLTIFDTYKWIEWLQSKNLPYLYKNLFSKGTLKSEYDSKLPSDMVLAMPDSMVKEVEEWLDHEAKQPKWNYSRIFHEFRHWIYS